MGSESGLEGHKRSQGFGRKTHTNRHCAARILKSQREEKPRAVRSGSGESECLADFLFRLTNCADSLTLGAESPWRADNKGGFLPKHLTNLSLAGPPMPCQIDLIWPFYSPPFPSGFAPRFGKNEETQTHKGIIRTIFETGLWVFRHYGVQEVVEGSIVCYFLG